MEHNAKAHSFEKQASEKGHVEVGQVVGLQRVGRHLLDLQQSQGSRLKGCSENGDEVYDGQRIIQSRLAAPTLDHLLRVTSCSALFYLVLSHHHLLGECHRLSKSLRECARQYVTMRESSKQTALKS